MNLSSASNGPGICRLRADYMQSHPEVALDRDAILAFALRGAGEGARKVDELQVGVDIVEIARVESSIRRFGDRFRRRVYTQAELAECGERWHSLADRL